MLQIYAVLPSGKRKSCSVDKSSKADDLKKMDLESFGKGFLRLLAAEVLALVDLTQSLQDAGLEDGDHLTALNSFCPVVPGGQWDNYMGRSEYG